LAQGGLSNHIFKISTEHSFSIAITITIKFSIRINHNPISIFQPDHDYKNFKQTLPENF